MSKAVNFSVLLSGLLMALSHATATEERLWSAEQRSEADRQTGSKSATEEGSLNQLDDGVAGEILVKFEEGVSPEQIDTINRRLGTTVVNKMMGGSLLLVRTPYPSVTLDLVQAYAATAGVEYAEPNQKVSIDPPPEGRDRSAPPSGSRAGGLPPPNEDGSPPLIPLPGPD